MKNTFKKSKKQFRKKTKKLSRKLYRKKTRKYKKQIGKGIVPSTNAKLYFNEKMDIYRGNDTRNMVAPIDPFIKGCDYKGFDRIPNFGNSSKTVVPSATAVAARVALDSDPVMQKYIGKICEYPQDLNRYPDNSNIKPILFKKFPNSKKLGNTGLSDGKYKYVISGRQMFYSPSNIEHIDCINLYAYNNNWPGYSDFPHNGDNEVSHSCLSKITQNSDSSFELDRDETIIVNAGDPMETVVAAGEFRIADGKIQKLNTYSGHFKPCSESIFIVFDFLTRTLQYTNLAIWPNNEEPVKEEESDECANYERYFIYNKNDKSFVPSDERNNYV